MTMTDPKKVAIRAAKKAGRILLKLSKKKILFEKKGTFDVCAEADLECEKAIIDELRRHFPGHSILSEEKGLETKPSEYIWIIDPLDGTLNFINGIDEYCVSIALLKGDEIILGVILQPTGKKLYVAEKGKGATLNGKSIHVSEKTVLAEMIATTDNFAKESERIQGFEMVRKVAIKARTLRIFGSAALHLAKVAEGKIDFYFKGNFVKWDNAAGMIIVEEAGGRVTDWSGKKASMDSKNVIASNKSCHDEIIRIINS
ncbi:MAG: inositol monophosphatase [archaeon]